MAHVIVLHPSFGVTAGVLDAARRLEAAGHTAQVVDQHDGRTFDDYEAAAAFVEAVGFPALMARALDAVRDAPADAFALGFSNGAGMATHIALHRPVAGVVLCSGALPVELLGATAWPSGVPAQLHATVDDPKRPAGHVAAVMRAVNEAGADAALFQYPGSGHLFTFPDRPDEHDPRATAALWRRVLGFVAADGRPDVPA